MFDKDKPKSSDIIRDIGRAIDILTSLFEKNVMFEEVASEIFDSLDKAVAGVFFLPTISQYERLCASESKLKEKVAELNGRIKELIICDSSFEVKWKKLISTVMGTEIALRICVDEPSEDTTEIAIKAINKINSLCMQEVRTDKTYLSMTQEYLSSPKTHQLKILPEYYQAVIEGRKKAELRKNDRDFSIGDYLLLTEWYEDGEVYTGRKVIVEITDITQCDFTTPNFVMLSFDGIDSINTYSFDGGIPF
ncbi:DUF3850 domain-containing protein [Yersinia enterocolitica]|uniref:DUF3850 domain-containing protein n=1 Tax=Yersinia enterocolitica TaxID=630 RepID=UPI0028B82734|nr:DUF3850 domain-containing protein [Yersinia enterocolitica]HDM8089762.1 DUF3850 domain-containing protein [Yersinia enterocolitica]